MEQNIENFNSWISFEENVTEKENELRECHIQLLKAPELDSILNMHHSVYGTTCWDWSIVQGRGGGGIQHLTFNIDFTVNDFRFYPIATVREIRNSKFCCTSINFKKWIHKHLTIVFNFHKEFGLMTATSITTGIATVYPHFCLLCYFLLMCVVLAQMHNQ